MANSLCIMVTRPDPGGTELCHYLQEQGDIAVHFPTIEFAPPADIFQFEQAIAQIANQDWLIFTSPQAVRASIPAIRRAWPQLPDKVHFAAVGAGTAKALQLAGYQVNCQPEKEWSSEGLLEAAPFKNIKDKCVAVIRGEGGREMLEPELTVRGANVLSVIAYRRVLPTIDAKPYLPLLSDEKIDVIVCTSYEGVANLKQIIGATSWPMLKRVPLIVVSERIKALAQNAGFQTIWVSSNASHTAIYAVITQKRKELCQRR